MLSIVAPQKRWERKTVSQFIHELEYSIYGTEMGIPRMFNIHIWLILCFGVDSAETARERNEWIASICQCLTALNITIQDPREMRIEVVRNTAPTYNQCTFK